MTFDSLANQLNMEFFRYSLATVILIGVVLAIRFALRRMFLEQAGIEGEKRRRRAVTIRNTLLTLFLVGIILIWAPRLQAFAVTLLAFAVALAIATKELIDCISGNAVRILNRVYSVGDCIEIGGIRGNVVDINMLSTTILEIGPGQTSHQYTGRAMTVPNSALLRQSVTNETYSKDYRLHIITVPLRETDDWEAAERILLEAANEQCQPFLEQAKRYMKNLEGETWLDAPSVEPRVTFQIPEPGRVNLLLRVACPTQSPARVEQAILRRFLSQFRPAGMANRAPNGS